MKKIKRPVVIVNNEKGITSNFNIDNKLNLVAFKTKAQAINYQLSVPLNLEQHKKLVVKIEAVNKIANNKINSQDYLEFKKDLHTEQVKTLQILYNLNTTSNKRIFNKRELSSLKILNEKKQAQNTKIKKLLKIKSILKDLEQKAPSKLKNINEINNEKVVYVTTKELYQQFKKGSNRVSKSQWKLEGKKKSIQKKIEKIQGQLRSQKNKLNSKRFKIKLKNPRFKKATERFQLKLETEKNKLKNKLDRLFYLTKEHKEEVKRALKETKQNNGLFNDIIADLTKESTKIKNQLYNTFKDKTDSSEKDLEDSYKEMKNYLTIFQGRNIVASSKNRKRATKKSNKKKEEVKQLLSVTVNPIKKIITRLVKEEERKKEQNNPIIVQVIFNILRGLGNTTTHLGEKQNMFETMYKSMEKYMQGIAHENKSLSIGGVEERIQSRLIQELINTKDMPKILEAQEILMKKYLEFDQVAKEFPKERLSPKDFKEYFDNFLSKKRDFKFCKKSYIRMVGKRKVYTMVNNIIAEDNKVYSLSLPKKRIKVPTLLQIYKKFKLNKVPGYKKKFGYRKRSLRKLKKRLMKIRRLKKLGKYFPRKKQKGKKLKKRSKKNKEKRKLKIGVLRIKLGRRNMFLMFRERRTNKVESVTTARRAYYRIFNTVDEEVGNKKKRSSKETVVKTKGPIGRYISTEQFRVRVLTQAFLDLRHKLKYNVLDIEIEKKSKKRFVKTIYKKYWYVFKNQGVFRRCSFVKNKAHGQMRRKKARRI